MRTQLAATLLLALDLLVLPSCRTEPLAPKIPESASPVAPKAVERTDHGMHSGPSIGARTHGVPHSSNIDMVTLSSDGQMALTRDSLGGLRLWPSLGGDAEPMQVPVRGALQVSLAHAQAGTIISAIDGVGSLHILKAQVDGSMKELYMSSPHAPFAQATVLPGAEFLVALSKDYRLSLLDVNGNVLSEIQERRFRPTATRVAEGRLSVLAIESNPAAVGSVVTLKTIDIDLAKKTLTLRAGERELQGVFNVAAKRFDLSPNGTHVAYLGVTPAPESSGAERKPAAAPIQSRPRPPQSATPQGLLVANLETGAVQAVELPLPAHEVMSVSVAFSQDNEVLVSSRPSGGSWSVSLGSEATSAAIPSPVANDSQRSANDVANGIRLAADGTWLFVQDVSAKTHHYLGYGAFDPQHSSISPNGERVSWSTGAMVFVESIKDDSKSIRITAPPTEAYFRAGFVDDAHLVTVDYSGGLHLIDWASGRQVGSLDTGGPIREFAIDQERKLIRGVRQNGGTWIAEFGPTGLVGPHLIQDGGYRSGFLDGERGLWSMDGSNMLRTFSIDEIRKGLSTAQLKKKGIDVSATLPTVIDSKGNHYILRAENQGAKLTITKPGSADKRELKLGATPSKIVPSPDGSKLALLSSSAATVEVVSATDGTSLWSRSFLQGVRHLSWSADSSNLAVASQVGALVQAGDSGAPVRLGCGPWFEKRATPPPSTVSFLQVQNLCERNPGQ